MKSEEILTCLILVAIGYFIAQLFSRCAGGNGFRVGASDHYGSGPWADRQEVYKGSSPNYAGGAWADRQVVYKGGG